MKALTVTGIKEFELKEIPIPKVTPEKVLIEVAYVGICGSDLPRYFEGGVHSFPQVLGHEFSGKIVEVGNQVTNLKVGDRVAVAPLIPDETTNGYLKGEPAMAERYSFIGSREQGAMAEFVAVPAKNVVKVPAELSLKEAAVLEPLTVAIHGIDRVNLLSGDEVVVLGAGTIGLLTLVVLRARGVGNITVVDINDHKLELAKKVGADVVVNPSKTAINEYFEKNRKPRVVIETAGSSITQRQAIEIVEKRGSVVYVGTSTRDVVLPPESFEKILRGELLVTGSWMSYSAPFPGYEWAAGLRYMATKLIDVRPLITGLYHIEDMAIPFEKMVEKDSKAVKLMYEIKGEAN
ncbi:MULTISPECIES: galactitol-1-phosphate 5-dehydrogenase [unclassified Enterococcus]|uniref:galactitol-1-phosphate 5-dehydrogenase n=1 Tax=unclassified Enterococcus TaxID=2608891 RepID=UPI001551F08C|nr:MULTISPECIES: galactitol-1-phosphate 5-dehydrogenase [unclassified Enterococcus]MBS7576084.1 galactitol-1-phosphate 5-dehydrogenase [Enterococcus sp. MMGLQ5-2]MBS7583317.1 galactitol-1-phosphate 5-dehydrogenase [Enterococcus sp. MMGLQ5-1]NPD11177.1 galactitol-1-phosphate 5-dehydrogenase [Enterococcus sp. MMGLQ5-1]NPD35920.1 galactitol-1-phosphate 5-dehydrogenase [Enterococcus sp. MMGLQ5-2]